MDRWLLINYERILTHIVPRPIPIQDRLPAPLAVDLFLASFFSKTSVHKPLKTSGSTFLQVAYSEHTVKFERVIFHVHIRQLQANSYVTRPEIRHISACIRIISEKVMPTCRYPVYFKEHNRDIQAP